MALELRQAGLEVKEGVGGTGVVAMLRNGDGPLILLRADMDGLPVPEKSGLDYASTVTQVGQDGVEYPVMHACGNDVHITSMVGTARKLMEMKDRWSGTIMFVVQPAEERVGGAKAMLADGLYERFGKPDYALAFHVAAQLPTGKVSAAAQNEVENPPDPYVHKAVGVAFPAVLGGFTLGRVVEFDEGGNDASVGYSPDGMPGEISLYVYPLGRSSCRDQFDGANSPILSRGGTVKEEDAGLSMAEQGQAARQPWPAPEYECVVA